MTIPVSQPDVEARLGRPLTTEETTRLPALISDAAAEVEGYCRQEFGVPEGTPVPAAVVGVVAKMVARQLIANNETIGGAFVDQQVTGPFTVHINANASSGDAWLTAADKLALRKYRIGGGLTSTGLVSERYRGVT